MNDALRKAVDVQPFREFANALYAESARPGAAEWAMVLIGSGAAIMQLVGIAEHAEAEIATLRDNYTALVIRLGEVTERLEAANRLLRESSVFVFGDLLTEITNHLKAAAHV